MKPGAPTRATFEFLQVRRATEDLLMQFDCLARGLDRAQENSSTTAKAVEIWKYIV